MKILVVDDSPIERLVLRSAVERLGHECIEAEDGEAAWRALNFEDFDVVLTDWLMPKLSGPDLCRKMRARTDAPYVYIVLCTVYSERDRGLDGVRAGADSFLTKPIDLFSLDMCLIAAERVLTMQRQLSHQNAELERLNTLLSESARTDPLTGLGNRRRLTEDLEKLASLVGRYATTVCAAMCDLDRFKAYNDDFGHLAGDAALREVGRILSAQLRASDSLYRYGGEELLVLLPHQTADGAMIAAERLRRAVEDAGIAHPRNEPAGVVTVSIGIAVADRAEQLLDDTLLHAADQALYEAKRNGRNRAEVHGVTQSVA